MRNPFKFGKEVSGYQFYDRTHTSLGELVDAGLVDRTPEQIRLADPLFAHYIRGKITIIFA